tara:strand:- start:4676 stop:5422 length:747 start_codon:yes stop_codon:yes gene_type:complete
MTIIDMIIEQKLLEISIKSLKTSIDKLKTTKRELPLVNFKGLFFDKTFKCIVEINQNRELDHLKIVDDLEGSISALSILTEQKYFKGSLSFLKEIKNNFKKPIIQNDFIVSEYQIYEAYISGADTIILIAEILNSIQLKEFYLLGKKLGMSVIIKIHDKKTVLKINQLKPEIILVSSRNLNNMKVSINRLDEILSLLPKNLIKIAEGGIKDKYTFDRVKELKYDALILGSNFLKYENPINFIESLVKK